jgi:hypothetical protein
VTRQQKAELDRWYERVEEADRIIELRTGQLKNIRSKMHVEEQIADQRGAVEFQATAGEATAMTTHTWIANAAGFILDSSNYTDGLPLDRATRWSSTAAPPTPAPAAGGGIGTLATGTYDFAVPAALVALTFQDVEFTSGSNMLVTGPGPADASFQDQVINAGAMTVGSSAAAGTPPSSSPSYSTVQPSFTNDGSITVQNDSSFTLGPTSLTFPNDNGVFLNAAGANSRP